MIILNTQMYRWADESQQAINAAVQHLARNHVVGLPTETVYGLAARFNLEALLKVYEVKQRPSDNPLILHVNSTAMAKHYIHPECSLTYFNQLTQFFWPGPLTLVLPKALSVSDELTGGLQSIAIRMPSSQAMMSVITALNEPLLAPSANISGRPSPTLASHVKDDFNGLIPAIIDDGACAVGIESTVLDLTNEHPTILRPGHIAQSDLEQVLGFPLSVSQKNQTQPKAPGMKYKHYAPTHTQIILCDEHSFMQAMGGDDNAWFYCSDSNMKQGRCEHLTQHKVYAVFREADRLGIDTIYILNNKHLQADLALFNRVSKAAEC